MSSSRAPTPTSPTWTQAYWFCACSLAALPPADVRLISGYESWGFKANFRWQHSSTHRYQRKQLLIYSVRPTDFAKTSSTLRIGRNRKFEMVNFSYLLNMSYFPTHSLCSPQLDLINAPIRNFALGQNTLFKDSCKAPIMPIVYTTFPWAIQTAN
jgi:hypothetical protein